MAITPKVLLVSTTSDSRETLERIAPNLLAQRLAACVQISGPITSHYWWNGALTKSEEFLLTAKCPEAGFPAVEAAIRGLHNYDVPEIIGVPVVASTDYAEWVLRETQSRHPD